MKQLTITPKEPKEPKRDKQGNIIVPKSRSFAVSYLGRLDADHMWDGGLASTDNYRPVILLIAGQSTELTPFLANIRKGRTADMSDDGRSCYGKKPDRIELLKTAPYAIAQQPLEDGTIIATAYLRSLIGIDGGMIDTDMCKFIAAVPTWWSKQQVASIDSGMMQRILAWANTYGVAEGSSPFAPIKLSHDQLWICATHAAYLMSYLDRRTKNPIMADMAFWLHLYFEGLKQGAWSLPQTEATLSYNRYSEQKDSSDIWQWVRHSSHKQLIQYGMYNVGFEAIYACNITHEALDTCMAQAVASFIGMEL